MRRRSVVRITGPPTFDTIATKASSDSAAKDAKGVVWATTSVPSGTATETIPYQEPTPAVKYNKSVVWVTTTMASCEATFTVPPSEPIASFADLRWTTVSTRGTVMTYVY